MKTPTPHEILRGTTLFSALSDATLDQFIRSGRRQRAAPGETIFNAGDEADRFYVILAGRVKVYQLSARGDEQILHLYGSGGTFGEAAMWTQGRFPADAAVLEDADLLVITRRQLREMIARQPEIALAMLAGMSQKLQEFSRLIEQLSLKEVPARLASVLLALSREAHAPVIHLTQSKRELAAQIGTIAETLSRALAKLKQAGLIAVEGRKITLLDPERLEELSES